MECWWTGKDSNLRTSQGGTDLQSVGFNHSPTRPILRADRALPEEGVTQKIVTRRPYLLSIGTAIPRD